MVNYLDQLDAAGVPPDRRILAALGPRALRLAAGEVSLDGSVTTAVARVRPGQTMVWRRPPWEEPAVPLAFAVLFRDAYLLAVAKPRGLPTMPAGGFLTHTLLHVVQARFPGATAAHRLGRGTSGLVLFARTDEARRALAKAWRSAAVIKRYRALVSGVPSRETFDVDTPIGLVDHPRLGRVYAAVGEGKPSLTHVRVLGTRDGRPWWRRRPHRPAHQIRIHLAAAGHPPAIGTWRAACRGRARPARRVGVSPARASARARSSVTGSGSSSMRTTRPFNDSIAPGRRPGSSDTEPWHKPAPSPPCSPACSRPARAGGRGPRLPRCRT
jgi:23S rRNA pseudouridine1911/1915/1917 synthase